MKMTHQSGFSFFSFLMNNICGIQTRVENKGQILKRTTRVHWDFYLILIAKSGFFFFFHLNVLFELLGSFQLADVLIAETWAASPSVTEKPGGS